MNEHTTDVVIIGAGPVALFAVFELGLLDLRATLIDILDQPGGQCSELYPDKPIYDIPAVPIITGQGLTDQLLTQIKPFKPTLILGQAVTTITQSDDGAVWHVTTDTGARVTARAVVIASGGGIFTPKKLPLANTDDYTGTSLFYAVRNQERFRGRRLVIAGGGDSAIDWALALAPLAQSLTLTHRRDEFRAAPARVAEMRALANSGKINLAIGTINALAGSAPTLSHVHIVDAAGHETAHEADDLLVFYGLTMQTGPLAQFGVALENDLVVVDTANFQTNRPGIFAIGDICTYPGKLKLILSGFHEGALMAQAAFRHIYPDKKLRFQYTTSSSDLQKKLEVRGE